MEKSVKVNYLSNDELNFLKWNGETQFLDIWESEIKLTKQPLHHYIFERNGKKFHISFSKISIVCSIITNYQKGKEKDIYKGYKWSNCLQEIQRYV